MGSTHTWNRKGNKQKRGSKRLQSRDHRCPFQRIGVLFIPQIRLHFRINRGKNSISCMSYFKATKPLEVTSSIFFTLLKTVQRRIAVFLLKLTSRHTCTDLPSFFSSSILWCYFKMKNLIDSLLCWKHPLTSFIFFQKRPLPRSFFWSDRTLPSSFLACHKRKVQSLPNYPGFAPLLSSPPPPVVLRN